MKKIVLLVAIYLGISFFITGKTRIFTIGDSTMADYDTIKYSGDKEQRGWCQELPKLISDNFIITNAAKNGRSSKSFYHEVWLNLRNELKSGDYVFIQFGHNDEKANGLDTELNDTLARGTAPWGQYQLYLKKYITETRAKGAIPILFTPVVRRYFNESKLTPKAKHNLSEIPTDTTLDYVYAMKKVAYDYNVPLIDLTQLSRELVEKYGPDSSKTLLYINKDDTHLKAEGAKQVAQLAIDELIKQHILFY